MYAYLALAGLNLVGGFQQADIIRQNASLQAGVADMNAKYAQVDAYNALETGYGNANKYETGVDSAIGTERATYASENVDVKYGTAANVESDNNIAKVQNVLQLQRQAQNQAAGFQAQAINLHLGGQMTQLQGNLNASSAESQGIMSAITTGIAGYAYGQSTGKGTSSRTGLDAAPGAARRQGSPVSMNLTPAGDGVRGPAGDESILKGYDNGYAWYGPSSQPFFGKGPRSSYNSSMDESYERYSSSFTGETGG
jgi:hypothetical protein